mgnify:CR=1 FL=1
MARPLSLQTLKVLAVLSHNKGSDLYGLEISEEAGLSAGTLYPILADLESKGWVTSEWENVDPRVVGRRRRRYYRITAEGAAATSKAATEEIRPLARLLGVTA